MTVADHTAADFSNPGLTAVRLPANGAKGRYVRLTATRLVSRLPTDYILAVAELEAFDAAGVNRAAGKAVTTRATTATTRTASTVTCTDCLVQRQ